ncbi:hypothetical protein F8O01_11440 [Pseudoclavibacter chungangensis]|uniref:Uncharacterized protein n=1 Tax=Pseudoclavibacter chungangensis TaxID=587635 RepID=A0A7J5BQ09_9MICO|nr:hypothetical protein [Pseudoclavibacter chungangensis]KAB1655612.1 hypothetical protein F8O01_11440 [Pseudoclavibacter chungangensis]NYJ67990.1 hypothetical protein [Pseudoclavibacter chungangensis]
MVSYVVNQAGVDQARRLVAAGRVDRERPWHELEPSTSDENAFLDANGWDAYGAWHLALREGASAETKERYGFVYGDFAVVSREALVAIAQRAGEWHHQDIEDAAHALLELLDS